MKCQFCKDADSKPIDLLHTFFQTQWMIEGKKVGLKSVFRKTGKIDDHLKYTSLFGEKTEWEYLEVTTRDLREMPFKSRGVTPDDAEIDTDED